MPQFTDEQYWSATDKEKVYKNFLSCLKDRSLEKMTELAYRYYTGTGVDFTAHYNRAGFKSYYSGITFLQFAEYFLHIGTWYGPVYSDLNYALKVAVQGQFKEIKADLERQQKNQQIEILQAMADSLGYRIIDKDSKETAADAVLCKEQEDGQLAFI